MQPGAKLGPYEIVAPLGAGGMGEVYRARDSRLGREVAVKVLPPEYAADPDRLRRFEQEARAVAALDHPNILAVHDVGTSEATPYLVTELLEGESLSERLNGGKLQVRRAVEVAIQIARGLASAHERGIVHRDLKPANVFITRDGHVKILDFGLAKLAVPRRLVEPAQASTVVEATDAGTAVGTVGYMSPEQMRGQSVDQRTDIFSFGCVLYEMLFGRRAFVGGSRADVMSAILHDEAPGLENADLGLPGPLRQIVRRCLEKRPADRFSSAHDLALALEAAGTETVADHEPHRTHERRALARRVLTPAVIITVALAAGFVWLERHRGPASLPQFHPRRVAAQFKGVSEAALSPDGTVIAYVTGEGGTSDIWVVDIRGGKPIRLTDGSNRAFGPAWFPDAGTVAFSATNGTETSLWKVPRFGGTAMLLVPNAQDASISPNEEQVAFVRAQEDGRPRIWVAPLSAPEQARRLTTDGEGLWDHRHPAWSPDGRTICYSAWRDLWMVPASGGAARRFTHEDAEDEYPVWSPGGAAVYFVSNRGGTRSLWRQSVAGGALVRVTRGAGAEDVPTISRDGRRLAFLSGVETSWVALVSMATGQVSRLEEGTRTATLAIGADDRSIVFESDLAGVSDLWSLSLRNDAPAGDPKRLTEQAGGCAVPRLSPDGRWIAYQRDLDGQRDIWVVPAEGGTPVNFTAHGGVNVEPAWRPDGRELAFISNRQRWHQVWAAPFANGRRTGNAIRLSREEGDAGSPCWAPDGNSVAYVLSTDTGSDVRVVPADGSGKATALTNGAMASQVRWYGARNAWVVSGFWGERRPSLRLVPPTGGATRELPIPSRVTLDMSVPYFEISPDGTLLAALQRDRQQEIWILEADEGSF
jgi:Tol biopolymer transport system component